MPKPNGPVLAAITIGFPSPNYYCPTAGNNTFSGILPGTYVVDTGTPVSIPPGQAKKHHVLAEHGREPRDDGELGAFWIKRPAALAPLPVPHQKPWHHIARHEEPEAEYLAPRRLVTIAPTPAPARYRPWWHGVVHEDAVADDAIARSRRLASPASAPPIVVPYRPPMILDGEAEAQWLPRPGWWPPAPLPPPAAAEAVDTLFIANLGRLMNRR